MAEQLFTEGVRPGGLTSGTEIRILLCYLLDSIDRPVSREEIENVLLGEELVNYFVLAEGLTQLQEQRLVAVEKGAYTITEAGRTVGRTLSGEVPRTVRDTAVRGVIQAQQYKAKAASHKSKVTKVGNGNQVHCSIEDEGGPLFSMELYMPDDLSAAAVKQKFVDKGDEVYKLVLAALTENRTLAEKALQNLK